MAAVLVRPMSVVAAVTRIAFYEECCRTVVLPYVGATSIFHTLPTICYINSVRMNLFWQIFRAGYTVVLEMV